jgi:hypothetical protein
MRFLAFINPLSALALIYLKLFHWFVTRRLILKKLRAAIFEFKNILQKDNREVVGV